MPLITLNDKPLLEKIHAVVLEKPYRLKHMTIPIWPIESYNDLDMILIQVKACGVCGSDFRYYQGENPWSQHTMGIHKENPPNIVLGHEFAGEVVAVLKEENSKWLGKRVVPVCSKVCGKCEMCRSNRAHLCENTIHVGHGQGWGSQPYYPGAYAEYVPAWGDGCYEIPPKTSFEEAAMMDVLAVCTHAFNQASYQGTMPILIMGCGPIGNGIGQVARHSGISEDDIIFIEDSQIAIETARAVGFQQIFDSSNSSLKITTDALQKIARNRKFYAIFDSIGTEFSFRVGLNQLDKGGTYVNLAVHQLRVEFNQMQLSGERKLTGSSNFTLTDYERTLQWLAEGKFNIKPWLTPISLPEIPKYFEDITKNKKARDYFKLVIQTI
jgi:threonine dehydrogenase-like Zn-dependent dehydrogenase